MSHAASQSTESPLQGVILMGSAMFILPIMDAIARHMALSEGMAPAQVTFYRFLFQLVAIIPFFLIPGTRLTLRSERPWLNIFRGVLHGAATLCFFTAVKYMPFADVFAIYFVEPFILTGLSAVFLKEQVGWRRWTAIGIGFIGALIVIQPSFEKFGLISLLPLACAALFAFYMFLNRAAGVKDAPVTMQTMAAIGGMAIMAVALGTAGGAGLPDFAPSLPKSLSGLLLLLLLGAISGYGHILVVRAFRLAPMSLLAPLQYFEIIAASLLGYFLFGEFPSGSKWLGIGIIVGSGLFIIWREQVRASKAAKASASLH
jgi:drug/metabolite transporter (DMT)-like permease